MTQQYGTVKVDFITFTSGTTGNETDITIPVSGLADIAESGINISGDITGRNITATGNLSVSGQAFFASGTEAAPSITFTDDLDTGFYKPAADKLAISTGGTSRVIIDDSGNFGVGTSDPDYKLQVSEGSSASISIKATADDTSPRATRLIYSFDDGDGASINATRATSETATDVNLSFRTGGITNSEERMRIDADGNVGIGITDSLSTLHVRSLTEASISIQTSTNANAGRATITKLAADDTLQIISSQGTTDTNITFLTDSTTERMRISSNGNVGINTSSPGTNLEINGSTGIARTVGGYRFLETVGGGVRAGITSSSSNDLIFLTGNDSEAARIDNSGTVVIGKSTILTNATATLAQLADSAGARVVLGRDNGTVNSGNRIGQVEFRSNGGNTDLSDFDLAGLLRCEAEETFTETSKGSGLVFSTTPSGSTNPQEHLRITNGGQVGIGTSDPRSKLVVQDFSDLTLNANTIDYTLFLEGGLTQGDGQYGASLAFNRIGDANRTGAIIAGKQTTADPDQVGIAFLTHASASTNTDLVEQMLITHDGKIGIGTTNPGQRLVVSDSGAQGIEFNPSTATACVIAGFNRSTSLYTDLDLQSKELILRTNGTSERARIDSSGRLLLAISTSRNIGGYPSRLQIEGGQNFTNSSISLVHNRTDSGGPQIRLGKSKGSTVGSNTLVAANDSLGLIRFFGADGTDLDSAAATIDCQVDGTPGTNDMPGRLVFSTTADGASSPTERMRIDSSGRLLVGTFSTFSIESIITPQIISASANGAGSCADLFVGSFQNAGGSGRGRVSGKLFLGHSRSDTSGSIGGAVGNNDRLGEVRFVGDDGSSFLTAAEIIADVDGTPGTNDMPGRLVFSTTADGASTPTVRMVINSFGTVLIGKTVDSVTEGGLTLTASGFTRIVRDNDVPLILQRLNTDGNIQIFRRDNATVGSISVTTTATAYNTSSDYRLKENVVPMTGAADRVKALKPSRFNFIADPDTTVDGFLAHEAQDVVPECVTGTKDEVDDEGNPVYQGIDQSKIVPLLTAALQEALAKIEALEQRLTDAGL